MRLRDSTPRPRTLLACALLALAGLSAGCGFQMRGATSLPGDLRSVQVLAPVDLAEEIGILLEGSGTSVAPDAASADAVIRVSRASFDRRVHSVSSTTGKESEFELSYSVAFAVTRRSGGAGVVTEQSFRLLRDYVFDRDAIVGSGREEDVLREEMVRDAARQLMRRVEAALAQ